MGNATKTTLQFTLEATAAVWWLLKDEKSELKVKDATTAKRVKRICKAIAKGRGIDKEKGKLSKCPIEIGLKDMKYLKDELERKFEGDGLAAGWAEGFADVLEEIDLAEDREVERLAEVLSEQKAQKALGQAEPDPEKEKDGKDEDKQEDAA